MAFLLQVMTKKILTQTGSRTKIRRIKGFLSLRKFSLSSSRRTTKRLVKIRSTLTIIILVL